MYPNALIYTMNGCNFVVPTHYTPCCNCGPQGPIGPPGPSGECCICDDEIITVEDIMMLLRMCGDDSI